MTENGSNLPTRVDRIEQLMEVLLTRHLDFEEEHKKLLTAQVLLADAQRKTEESLVHLSSRVDALVNVVDDIVRGRTPPPKA